MSGVVFLFVKNLFLYKNPERYDPLRVLMAMNCEFIALIADKSEFVGFP